MNRVKVSQLAASLVISGVVLALACWVASSEVPVARASPDVFFVKPAGSGTSCTQAAPCELDEAMAQAGAFDTIYVSEGVYYGSGSAVITITDSITVIGGWDGAVSGPVVVDPVAHTTTLDGEDARRGIFIVGVVSPTLDGFTITGGDATGLAGDAWGYDAGGGIYVIDAAPVLRRLHVISSKAERGGGLYLYNSAAVVSNSFIRDNNATRGGAGLFAYICPATFNDVAFINNDALGGDGGGMYLSSSDDLILRRPLVAMNTSLGHGGGIYMHGSAVTVTGGTFRYNSAKRGGAIGLYNSDAVIAANMIYTNTATEWGGGAFLYQGDPVLINNMVFDNYAGDSGAGLFFWSSGARGWHNTVAHNQGGDGSGITVDNYSTTYSGVALTNTILVKHGVGVQVTLDNSISLEGTLWGAGASANGTDWLGAGTIATGTVNLWEEPRFIAPLAPAWNLHLRWFSPAIDAGVPTMVLRDIDGQNRPNGTGYDIGADEAWWWRVDLPVMFRIAP